MTSLDVLAPVGSWPAVTRSKPSLVAVSVRDWAAAEARWDRLSDTGEALAFQRTPWVRAWYRHCVGPGVEPLVVFLTDAESGADRMGLALVRQREGVRRVITFADRGLTDYNAPLLGPSFPAHMGGQSLWHALKAALPATDMVRFEKMPVAIDDRANPLAELPGVRPSKFSGHVSTTPDDWDDWVRSRDRNTTRKLTRCGRTFDKLPGSAFRRCEPGAEAERVYDALRRLQRARMADFGKHYILDDEPAAGFYDSIVREGLRDGSVVLTALTVDEQIIAVVLCITDGEHCSIPRLTMDNEWQHISPGLLLIERTMTTLHAEGYRRFDLTIGDYQYKRKLGAKRVPMVEWHKAVTPLGWPEVAEIRFKAWARGPGRLQDWMRKRRAEPAASVPE